MSQDEVQALKDRHHATWAAGDYDLIAKLIEDVAAEAVRAAEIESGQDVLDVATGTGNAALLAAQAGARVTGLDLTPELFDVARQRAGEAGVEVEWVAGDAEDLPFDDESFDRILSTCGVQFAPRHEVVAQELARVCRPGGRMVLCNWTSDGKIGELFRLMGRYMPKPPPFASPPFLWGDEDHVRGLFESVGMELRFERTTATLEFESPEAYVEHFERYYGPTIKAKEALEPKGKWAGLREEWLALAERFFGDGGVQQDYFVITGQRAG
jgi:ubiquinone/menaquinone biosynthesis C-methylase UbiE